MHSHVSARCGEHALLFPAENIAFIEPVPARAGLLPRSWRREGDLVIDVRRLLGVIEPAPADRGVLLHWRSTDGARAVTLLVDAVEGIVAFTSGDLVPAPLLPARLRPFCDHVLPDGGRKLRLRIRPDVKLALRRRGDRRRLVESLLTRSPTEERE